MASFHLTVKAVQRSHGRSATASAAYRHAERIECDREGRVHDYRAKAGVEASFIVAPEDAPAWAQDRQALWNAAEARENRKDSVTAREWEVALPHELDGAGRRALVEGFARELVDRYGVAADVAIHAPHHEGDQRNWHAHVMTTTRKLEREGFASKTRVLDVKATGGPEIVHMRERWAEMQNRALERLGVAERVDHRSLAVQREAALARGEAPRAEVLDRAAEVKLGPVVSGIERREERAAEREGRAYQPVTERGALVHEAREARTLATGLALLREALREEVARQAERVRERAEAARATYAHAREEGTSRISAGLAALRAAAQRQGIGHEGAREGVGHENGHEREAARDTIRDRLARLREQGLNRDSERALEAGRDAIRERLARLRGRGTGQGEERTAKAAREVAGRPEPGHGQEQEPGDIRERLQRILEQENQRTHEGIREQLNAALGRAKPTAREREAHEREGEAPRHGQRARGHGLGH